MKRINSLESLPENIDILTGIDLIGNIKRLFKTPARCLDACSCCVSEETVLLLYI